MVQIPPPELLNYKKEDKRLNLTIHRLSLYVGSIRIKQKKKLFLAFSNDF